MLMRSENVAPAVDCDDAMVKAACLIDDSSCPAACKTTPKDDEPTVVKAGDLAVTAKAADGRKAIIGAPSDLDTLTFKTSEEVIISKVTLERYGYSSTEDVQYVWLEDEDGNVIAEKKPLGTKGQVNLTVKKDYRTVDGTFRATIVLQAKATANPADQGTNIGFKVVDVESTAKNLNVDDYSPYTYDLITYAGSQVTFSIRGSDKIYNYEAGESYEVSKFRVKAPADSAILVRGFTLKNLASTDKLDDRRYVENVKVTFDGEVVKWLKWEINKLNELVVSFNEVEIVNNKDGNFAVNVELSEDFSQFGNKIQYKLEGLSKFNATDKKTESRVKSTQTDDQILALSWNTYTFNGGKIKLSGTKLGNVNAAAGSENVVVAEWEISVTEAIRSNITVKVSTNFAHIEDMILVINGEEFDGTPWTNKYTFPVEIEKSGKFQIKVSLKEAATPWDSITFGVFNSTSFADTVYDESNSSAAQWQIVGSLPISTLKVQAAKASLTNSLTKSVNFVTTQESRKTIFDGTYTAKKWTVTLTWFEITKASGTEFDPITFYVTIDGTEYDVLWDATNDIAKDSIDLKVAADKSVSVKVEAEFTPGTASENAVYNIAFYGEDEEWNQAWLADEDCAKIATVTQWSIDVDSTARNTVLLKSERNVAKFLVKPSSNNDEEVTLETLEFTLSDTSLTSAAKSLKVEIDDDDVTCTDDGAGKWTCSALWLVVPSAGLEVNITLKSEYAGELTLTLNKANNTLTRVFRKMYLPAKVYVASNDSKWDTTNVILAVEKEWSESITNVRLHTDDGVWHDVNGWSSVANNDNVEIKWNSTSALWIDAISYCVDKQDCTAGSAAVCKKAAAAAAASSDPVVECGTSPLASAAAVTTAGDIYTDTPAVAWDPEYVLIEKATYNDYFKVGNTYAKVSKAE